MVDMPADLSKPADAEPFVKDAQHRPGCAAGSRIHITVHRKSGVPPGSLGFEPRAGTAISAAA